MQYAVCEPLKRQAEGSLLLPCSKMPIAIFLFARKSNFQKSEENGEKRRKPEKISGFFGWHFCQHVLEASPRFELGIEVLQTFALPLGYDAAFVCLNIIAELFSFVKPFCKVF